MKIIISSAVLALCAATTNAQRLVTAPAGSTSGQGRAVSAINVGEMKEQINNLDNRVTSNDDYSRYLDNRVTEVNNRVNSVNGVPNGGSWSVNRNGDRRCGSTRNNYGATTTACANIDYSGNFNHEGVGVYSGVAGGGSVTLGQVTTTYQTNSCSFGRDVYGVTAVPNFWTLEDKKNFWASDWYISFNLVSRSDTQTC